MQSAIEPSDRGFGPFTKIWLILLIATFTYTLVNDWLALAHLKIQSNPELTSLLALLQVIICIEAASLLLAFILLVSRKRWAFWLLVFLGFATFSINLRLDIPLSECAIGLIGTGITWILVNDNWSALR